MSKISSTWKGRMVYLKKHWWVMIVDLTSYLLVLYLLYHQTHECLEIFIAFGGSQLITWQLAIELVEPHSRTSTNWLNKNTLCSQRTYAFVSLIMTWTSLVFFPYELVWNDSIDILRDLVAWNWTLDTLFSFDGKCKMNHYTTNYLDPKIDRGRHPEWGFRGVTCTHLLMEKGFR